MTWADECCEWWSQVGGDGCLGLAMGVSGQPLLKKQIKTNFIFIVVFVSQQTHEQQIRKKIADRQRLNRCMIWLNALQWKCKC